MTETKTYGTDSIHPVDTTGCINDSMLTGKMASLQVQGISKETTSQNILGDFGVWLGGGGILLGVLCLQILRHRTLTFKKVIDSLISDIESLQNSIKLQEEKLNDIIERSLHHSNEPNIDGENERTNPEPSLEKDNVFIQNVGNISKGENDELIEIRYANMQQANNELRFAERTMDKVSSSSKMFMLQLDYKKGVGEYRINVKASDMIMSDLQTFSAFVKPFDVPSLSRSSKIIDGTAGRIQKVGDFWIVQDKLEIIFK